MTRILVHFLKFGIIGDNVSETALELQKFELFKFWWSTFITNKKQVRKMFFTNN